MVEIQKISNLNSLPKNESIVKWAIKALEDDNKFLSEQEKVDPTETQINQ